MKISTATDHSRKIQKLNNITGSANEHSSEWQHHNICAKHILFSISCSLDMPKDCPIVV